MLSPGCMDDYIEPDLESFSSHTTLERTIIPNTMSIFITSVDPKAQRGSLPALSRTYAVASYQLFNYTISNLPSGGYNAELVKQLTPEMQDIFQKGNILVTYVPDDTITFVTQNNIVRCGHLKIF